MPTLKSALLIAVGAASLALSSPDAHADEGPGVDAIREFRDGRTQRPVVENRFFLKEGRFEIAPMFGYVPNNPFAVRYVGGVGIAYHFTENLAAEGVFNYSPDLGKNDIKGLTYQLIQLALKDDNFQQPLTKVGIQAGFTLRATPFYGKINLVGETVLNFDFYGSVGLGMASLTNYYARYNGDNQPNFADNVDLVNADTNEAKLSPILGLGSNFFVNQTAAIKFDARFNFYLDNQPQYSQTEQVTEQRIYNNFVASIGLALYFPKMKPRLYDF